MLYVTVYGKRDHVPQKINFQLALAFANRIIATCVEKFRFIGRIVCDKELFFCTDCTKQHLKTAIFLRVVHVEGRLM